MAFAASDWRAGKRRGRSVSHWSCKRQQWNSCNKPWRDQLMACSGVRAPSATSRWMKNGKPEKTHRCYFQLSKKCHCCFYSYPFLLNLAWGCMSDWLITKQIVWEMSCLKTHWCDSCKYDRGWDPLGCKSTGRLLSLYSICILLYNFSCTLQHLAFSGGSTVDTMSFLALMTVVKFYSSRALMD